jgi:multicomponent Na+:H+ antiporter subunit F
MADNLFVIAGYISIIAGLLGVIRFLIGPTLADRVVAFDVLTIIGISVIVLIAHIAQRAIYIDAAIVYGLLSFLGVIVVARYMEGGL